MYATLVVGILFLLCSCSSRLSRCESQVESYRHGDGAEVQEEKFPIGVYTENKDAVRLYLDRGVMKLSQGDAKGSLADFIAAIDAIEYYRKILPQEKAAQLLLEDDKSPYIAKRYEALFARLYAAFACYALDEIDNAAAFIRQAYTYEDLQNELRRKNERSPLLSTLMALHHESRGDKATVLWIVHEGLIPELESITAPASVASAVAVEILLAAWNIPPAISSVTGIALPSFPDAYPCKVPSVSLDGKKMRPEKIEDLFAIAKAELDEDIPGLAAQAVARQLIRRAAVGTVREKSPLAGDIADLFVLAANLMTEADTRMWKTLPQEIYFLRMDLPPGTYKIDSKQVTLKRGDLYVHQLFHY